MFKKIVAINDPFSMVLQAADRIWGDVSAIVQYDDTLEEIGLEWATAEDKLGNNVILINPYLTIRDSANALARAITRLRVGKHVDMEDEVYTNMLNKLVHTYADVDGRKAFIH